jgi:carboxyl-terminal processing protease
MKRYLVLFGLLLSGLVAAKPAVDSGASPLLAPTEAQGEAAATAARILSRFHYKAEPLDARLSAEIFDRYFDLLDGDRLFFLQADIDRFAPQRETLGQAIEHQDLSLPFAIFNLYEQRVAERTAYARELLKKGFDFNTAESYRYQRDKLPWAKTREELDDVWRKRVKNDWLRLRLAGKKDAEIRSILDKRYANYLERVHQLNAEDVFQTFMNAYATSIDPHTNYLGPRASENFDIAMRLSLEGIGAVLQRDDEYTAVREIVPGGPAALSGKLKVGDRIVGVGQGTDGPITDVIGWRLDDVVDLIRGPKDTTVRLEVLPADAGPDGKHVVIALTRKKVSIEEQAAKSSVIEIGGSPVRRIGVISLPTFYEDFEARRRGDRDYKSATRDVARLLGELKQRNVDAVLIDLRNNGGGSLSEAIELTGLFVGKGPVVQVRSANGRVELGRNTHTEMVWDGPLAVLVNRNSASASEIFAAAIQDYGRGLILGEPTFGKGTVQNLVDLDQWARNEKPTFGELKMTIQQFFRVAGGSTQLRGVTADIEFPITADFDQNGEQTYRNALPWSAVPAASYTPTGDLKPIIPLLRARHEARIATDREWQAFAADLADARRMRMETTISLNEQTRRAEREEQERKRRERHPELAAADAATAKSAVIDAGGGREAGSGAADGRDPHQDDGLQADERSLRTELAQEKARKAEKDVVLQEAAHILADEVDLIREDRKLAAQVLPHVTTGKPARDLD